VQDKYGVKTQKAWINQEQGTVFCLFEAPSKEACMKVHQEAHGNVACNIIEVQASEVTMFMGPGNTNPVGQVIHPDGDLDKGVRAFLFTDIVDSTAITEAVGDTAAFSIIKKHNEIVRNIIGVQSGREIKHTGDGIMVCFKSTSKAVMASINIQRDFQKYREDNSDIPLHVRIGVNAGEPVTERDDFFGTAVQLAKRVCDLAESDHILISNVVHELCQGSTFDFIDLGKKQLKGFKSPQELFEVIWKN
jgi:class 3 adenylate cyclase